MIDTVWSNRWISICVRLKGPGHEDHLSSIAGLRTVVSMIALSPKQKDFQSPLVKPQSID